MNLNDVLRRIRYVFDFDDNKMIELFAKGGCEVNRAQVSDWLKREDDPACQSIGPQELASFLNGLISDRRGEREGPKPVPEKQLTNNIIFMKLKIALNLKAEDVMAILQLADFRISKGELSAFFRRAGHKNFRVCKDQVLRNFLKGVQLKFHDKLEPAPDFEW